MPALMAACPVECEFFLQGMFKANRQFFLSIIIAFLVPKKMCAIRFDKK